MSESDPEYKCANRKCKRVYRKSKVVWVLESGKPGPKTLPTYRGTCPNCGHDTFYVVNEP